MFTIHGKSIVSESSLERINVLEKAIKDGRKFHQWNVQHYILRFLKLTNVKFPIEFLVRDRKAEFQKIIFHTKDSYVKNKYVENLEARIKAFDAFYFHKYYNKNLTTKEINNLIKVSREKRTIMNDLMLSRVNNVFESKPDIIDDEN